MMRTTSADWEDIRERLKVDNESPLKIKDLLSESHRQTLLDASRIRFNANKDNPVVQGLKRFITGPGRASTDDVLSWFIEATEGDEKAFRVWLSDGRIYIGTLVPSVAIEGRWVCSEYFPGKQSITEEEALKTLQFASNVIELKPDKKYLLAFSNINHHQLNQVQDALRAHGFDCLCFSLPKDGDLQVIEAPKSEPDPLWQQLSRDMTINERRAIFAKLAEHLGVDIDEQGNTDDGIKKRYSLDEAKAILKPHWKVDMG